MIAKEYKGPAILVGTGLMIFFLWALLTPSKQEQQAEKIFAENTQLAAKRDDLRRDVVGLLEQKTLAEETIAKARQLRSEMTGMRDEIAVYEQQLAKIENLDALEAEKTKQLKELTATIAVFSGAEDEDNITAYIAKSNDHDFLARYISWEREEIIYVRLQQDVSEAAFTVAFSELDAVYRERLLAARENKKYLGMDWYQEGKKPYHVWRMVDFDTGIRWYDQGTKLATNWKPFSAISKTERNAYEGVITSKLNP